MICYFQKQFAEDRNDARSSGGVRPAIPLEVGQPFFKVLKAGGHFEHFGDVTINGSVPSDTQVTVTEGNVIITGNVHSGAKIILLHKCNAVITMRQRSDQERTDCISKKFTLKITGNVYRGTIKTVASNVLIDGYINKQSNVETVSGDIQCLEAIDSSIKTVSGNVSIKRKLQNTRVNTKSGNLLALEINSSDVETTSGKVSADKVIQHSNIKTISGNLHALEITSSDVKTISGKVSADKKIQHSNIKTVSGNIEYGMLIDTKVRTTSGRKIAKNGK